MMTTIALAGVFGGIGLLSLAGVLVAKLAQEQRGPRD